jgi:protein-S-isoprenylcysteine O-methyltransferase Ste14
MKEAAAWLAVRLSATTIPAEAWRWTQGLWIVLTTVWVVGIFRTRKTVRRQTNNSRIWQLGIVLLGFWLIFGRGTGIGWIDAAAFSVTLRVATAGVAITLAGVAFAIWARTTLGRNWSGVVTLKDGHTLVRRGPYRIVRHPIYTGLLMALAGTALTSGTVRSILALPIVAFGFWLKMLIEERFMVEEFGDEYLRYRREVPAVVPFLF